MTSWPSSARRAAATEESTPPDIATTTRTVTLPTVPHRLGVGRLLARERQVTKLLNQTRQDVKHAVDLGVRREEPQAEPKRVLRTVGGKAHGPQHVRRLEGARRAGRARRDGDAL